MPSSEQLPAAAAMPVPLGPSPLMQLSPESIPTAKSSVFVNGHSTTDRSSAKHPDGNGYNINLVTRLTPELRASLEERHCSVLRYLVDTNSKTVYWREGELLTKFKAAIDADEELGALMAKGDSSANTILASRFASSVPLSTYDDMKPFIARFSSRSSSQPTINKSDVVDLLAPGLPFFIAHSSATTGGTQKHFPKYNHPKTKSYEMIMAHSDRAATNAGGKNLITYSLCNRQVSRVVKGDAFLTLLEQVIQIVNDRADEEKKARREQFERDLERRRAAGEKIDIDDEEDEFLDREKDEADNNKRPIQIPVCIMSTGTIRMTKGLTVDQDPFIKRVAAPNAVSPLAVSFVKNYKSFIIMHCLFALAERNLQLINTMFSTLFIDLLNLLEENWDMLLIAIEEGTIPHLEGAEDLEEFFMLHFKADPARAAELRAIPRSEGWLKRVWPDLDVVIAICSGTFSNVIPKIRWHIGDRVAIETLGLTCSESMAAVMHDPKDLNLFKVVGTDDIIEYLPAEAEETPDAVVQPWNVRVGGKYELVLTTRDGFWRYKLGDIIEIAGFDPLDGQPLIRYAERRGMGLRLANEIVTELELRYAVDGVSELLGPVTEFTVVVDYRKTMNAYGFLIELQNDCDVDSPEAQKALDCLLTRIDELNPNFGGEVRAGKLHPPTFRLMKKGTFTEYRQWRVELSSGGSGQIKVPVVAYDDVNRKWLLERVVGEIVKRV
ncbi:hypothetical protein HK101_004296 [Irineochytrium annulatum]|nr:hypothetical protein HK101_004296 [Irineochytrium annulatum]